MREDDLDQQFYRKKNLRRNMMRALKGVVHASIWDGTEWKEPPLDSAGYSSSAAPSSSASAPPSAVASNASNSSDDSSRNLPRDK
jgi:hypothetical protein